MWAMMPMLRILSSGVVRGIALPYSAKTRGDRDARHSGRSRSAAIREGIPPWMSLSCLNPGLAPGVSCLPPVVCEGPVGLGHPVRVFLLLYGLTLTLRGEDQLGGQPLRHVLFAPGAAERNQPAHAERGAPLGPNFHRHLVRRAPDAARLHLER